MIETFLKPRRKVVYRCLFGMVLALSLLLTSCGGASPAQMTETAIAAFTPTPTEIPTPVGITPDQDLTALITAASDGDVITLAPGVFTLTQGVMIDKSLTIIGAGSSKTTITSDNPVPETLIMIGFSGSGTLTLKGINLEYTGSSPSLVLYIKSGSLVMEDCALTGATVSSSGTQLGAIQLANNSVATIRNSQINGSTNRINSDEPDKIPGGIIVNGSAQLTLEDSVIQNSYLGVYAYGDSVVNVSKSTIKNNYAAASLLENASGTLTNNTIESSKGVQIGAFGSSKLTALENTLNNLDSSNGIQINGTAYAHIEKNKINNGLSAIIFSDNSTGEAVANEINTVSNIGIFVQKEAVAVVDSNIFQSCYIGISFEGNSSGSVLNNNILFSDIGISITSPANPSVTGNTVQGFVVALTTKPQEWLDQLDVKDNHLTDGEPEITIVEVSTKQP